MSLLTRRKKGDADAGSSSSLMDIVDPSADLADVLDPGSSPEGESGDTPVEKNSGRERPSKKSSKKPKEVVLPSTAILARVRRVYDGCVEDYNGVRFAVWELRGCDVLEPQSVNGWASMLNSVEYPVQIIIRQHAPDYSDIKGSLRASRPEHMQGGWMGEVCDSLLDYMSDLEESTAVVSRRWYVVGREDKSTELSAVLSQSGFEATRLDDENLSLLFQACLGGMGFGHTREVYQAKLEPNFVELNERYASLYEVSKRPRTASPLFLERLLQSGQEFDVSLWISPVPPREGNSLLQMQRSRFEGSKLVSVQKGKLVHPEVELAISDIMRISDGVERGVTRLYRRTMTFAVYGRTREALRDAQEVLEGHFRSSLANVRRLKYRQGQAFACMMPVVRRGLSEAQLTDSDTLLRLFPFGPRDLDRREGTLLGTDLRSKTSVFFDGFAPHAMNGHVVVMARSGAGKSFFTKLRTLRESSRGIPIYIIDPEGEYGVITRPPRVRVFVPGSKGYGLNPFVFQYSEDSMVADVTDNLVGRVASLGSLVGVMLEGEVNQDRKATIDHCLTEFYDDELQRSDGSGMLGRGGMKAFHDFLQSEKVAKDGGRELAHLLSPFATGSSRFLMQESDNDLLANESPVTSFNLKNLNAGLKPVATSVCAEVVWALAVTNPKPRILIVDECWTVLATPSGAEALITIVKRARKYRLGLMAITQDVQDLLSENQSISGVGGHAGRSLLQNSALKIALQQDAAALPLVADALGLNEDMREFLESSLRGQGLLVDERGGAYPIQVVATPQESELIENRDWLNDGNVPIEEMVPEAVAGARIDSGELRDGDISGMLRRRLSAEREMETEDEALAVV
jgi:hypothetical protein